MPDAEESRAFQIPAWILNLRPRWSSCPWVTLEVCSHNSNSRRWGALTGCPTLCSAVCINHLNVPTTAPWGMCSQPRFTDEVTKAETLKLWPTVCDRSHHACCTACESDCFNWNFSPKPGVPGLTRALAMVGREGWKGRCWNRSWLERQGQEGAKSITGRFLKAEARAQGRCQAAVPEKYGRWCPIRANSIGLCFSQSLVLMVTPAQQWPSSHLLSSDN